MITLTQHSLPPFKPLNSFLAYATGDEEITLKENSVAKIIRNKTRAEGGITPQEKTR